jgi:peptidoglycan/xylan/chitin deacetylase (PgdA/CDA1 family)
VAPTRRLLSLLIVPLLLGLFPQVALASTRSSGSASTAFTYVPVLMYHYIRVNPDPRDRAGYALSVTPAMFHAQMDYLARNHFTVIPLSTAVQAIRNHRVLAPRSVVLTFDDGYADFSTLAVPQLRGYGFTATDYVVPGLVGRPSFMTWSQVVQADRLGFTIAAHTMHHVPLARISRASAIAEMSQSKQVLEGMLGHPVIEFAYPYGSFNAYLAGQARAIGFESAASTMPGAWHQPGELWWLDRQRVSGYTSLPSFARLVGGPRP